jgi:alkaline phosphatase
MRHGTLTVALIAALLAPSDSVAAGPKRARNVILFIADAGGVPTLNAASLHGYQAPLRLHVQGWPHLGLTDTSPARGFVADSASSMTAIVTGQKTMNGVISQGPEAVRGKQDGRRLKSILEYAEEHGLRTGVVTDMPITDATPAACYASANDRGKWAEMFPQAFEPRFGDGVDVLIGGGRAEIEKRLQVAGQSFDALATRHGRAIHPTLEAAAREHGRMVVVADRVDVRAAALRALDELQKGPKGYFLMVEWDTHTHDPKPGLEAMVAFDKLIKEIQARVNVDDTLLLFTADHSFALRTKGEGSDGAILAGYDEWKAAGGLTNQPIRLKSLLVDNAHSGEEVATLAIGAGSERVSGYFPNTRLFHIMLEAWGWKPDRDAPAR